MEKNVSFYENEIIHSIDKIELYINNMSFENFCDDSKTFDACCMQLQHIGECGVKLGNITQNNYKNIPFVQLRGFRNKITHDYAGVDEEIIWKTIQISLPELKKLLLK